MKVIGRREGGGKRHKERKRDSLYTRRVRPQSLTSVRTNDRSDMGKQLVSRDVRLHCFIHNIIGS